MIQQEGYIEIKEEDYTKRDMLFTYSEEEVQEGKKNKEHAKLLFSPKFVPFYPNMVKEGYSLSETLLFGFIDFFLSNNKEGRFYFSDSDLESILGISERSISSAVKKLSDDGLIQKTQKMKAGGGTIRFIQFGNRNDCCLESAKTAISYIKENKIKKNKINRSDFGFSDFLIKQIEEYDAGRKKKLSTHNNIQKRVDNLKKLGGDENGMYEVLEQSIVFGREGLFPLKKGKEDKNAPNKSRTDQQRFDRILSEKSKGNTVTDTMVSILGKEEKVRIYGTRKEMRDRENMIRDGIKNHPPFRYLPNN